MSFDLNEFVKKYSNTEFILLFIFIFFVLTVILAFVKFVSQWPVLILISFLISFLIYNHFSKNPDPLYNQTKDIMNYTLQKGSEEISKYDLLNNSILFNNDNQINYS